MSTKKYPNADIFIGSRIRGFRKQNGYTLVEFSKKIGISHGSLSDIETGKTKPSADTLASICRNTDINITWLLTGEPPDRWDEKHGNIVEIEHINIIKKFKNKPLAKELNELLIEIEGLDGEHLREIKGLLRSELLRLKERNASKKAKLAGE